MILGLVDTFRQTCGISLCCAVTVLYILTPGAFDLHYIYSEQHVVSLLLQTVLVTSVNVEVMQV